GCEVPVAAAARAAPRDDDARIRRREVGDDLVVREHLCPHRDPQLDAGAVRAVLARAAPRLASPGPERALGAEGREVAELRVRDQHDVSPASAVPAVGAALGHELLAAEAEPAVA